MQTNTGPCERMLTVLWSVSPNALAASLLSARVCGYHATSETGTIVLNGISSGIGVCVGRVLGNGGDGGGPVQVVVGAVILATIGADNLELVIPPL